MNHTQNLLNTIKNINKDMQASAQGMSIVFGQVISANPLQIKVGEKLVLDEDFLTLSYAVREKKINIQHTHTYTDSTRSSTSTKTTSNTSSVLPNTNFSEYILIPALKTGEEVILIRMEGGQQFIVLDRVVKK